MSATPSRLSNYVVPVPGSDVTACLGVRHERDPGHWIYTLWVDYNHDEQEMIAQGSFDLDGLKAVTPEQVARIAFLLECEYPTVQDLRGPAGEGDLDFDTP